MIRQTWQVVGSDVHVAVDEAEWWGASLGVLIAAAHHPSLLATSQPTTDPADVAHKALAEVAELYAAAAVADAQVQHAGATNRPGGASVRRDGAEIVIAPGGEVADLAWCIEVFATAVLDPSSPDSTVARGATAHAASAWSTDIGKASWAPRCCRAGRRRVPMIGRHQPTAGAVGLQPKDSSPAVAAFPPTAGASAYGGAALSRELEAVCGMVVDRRNDGLNRAVFCLGRLVGGGELSEPLVAEAVVCAALSIGLGESEVVATIRSGLRTGMAVPRRALDSRAWRRPEFGAAMTLTGRADAAVPPPRGEPNVDPAG